MREVERVRGLIWTRSCIRLKVQLGIRKARGYS